MEEEQVPQMLPVLSALENSLASFGISTMTAVPLVFSMRGVKSRDGTSTETSTGDTQPDAIAAAARVSASNFLLNIGSILAFIVIDRRAFNAP